MTSDNKEFDNINNLYSRYAFISEKQNEDGFALNWEKAFENTRDEIFKAILGILGKSSSSEIYDFVDSITEEIDSALTEYPKNNEKHPGEYTFSQYVFMKIRNRTGSERSRKIAMDNNGGSYISEHEAKMIRKVRKTAEILEKSRDFASQTDLNENIAAMLDIKVETVEKYRLLAQGNTVSIEKSGEKGEGADLNSPEKHFFQKENDAFIKKILPEVLNAIDSQHDSSDSMESELLTLMLLESLKNEREDTFAMNHDFYKIHEKTYERLRNYQFIDKEMLERFFKDKEYVLIRKKEIADKYKQDKSSSNKKIERFRAELIKQHPEFKDILL